MTTSCATSASAAAASRMRCATAGTEPYRPERLAYQAVTPVSLPLAGRAKVGVLVPRLHRLSLTPPPPSPPHRGEESRSRLEGSLRLMNSLRREHPHGAGPDREMRGRLGHDLPIRIDRPRPPGADVELLGPDGAHLAPGPVLAVAEGARHERQLPGALQFEAVEIEILVVD